MNRRVLIIIIDGVGVGELPDAAAYSDEGSNTLGNMARQLGGLNLPNLEALGLGKIAPIQGLGDQVKAIGGYGKMAEISPGKDSTTGHWELAGLILDQPFPTYPNGFPEEVIRKFKELTGYDVLGNKPASGTEIIKELGEQHLKTGQPIVYTSADSVFQIAAHDDVIPLKKLYEICEISRKMLTGKHAVARVIARPFVGDSARTFTRTKYRRDFSLEPVGKTMHVLLSEAGIDTIGIGKINDLYARAGIQHSIYTKTNQEGMAAISEALDTYQQGLIMANLVDFDMLWGHRNDVQGFYRGLREFDSWLPEVIQKLTADDMLVITADHGNDPTTPSTDHSREYVPVLVHGPSLGRDVNLGVRKSFADLQATIAEYFGIESTGQGESFLPLIYG